MADINTWSGLEKALQKQIQLSMVKVGETIKQVLKDNLQRMYYSEHTPHQYQRTMQVLDSIRVDNIRQDNNSYSAIIYFDTDSISPAFNIYDRGPYQFNTHMSVGGETSYSGKTIGELLVGWMEEGQNSPLFSYDGAGFIAETKRFAREDAVEELNSALRSRGINSVVVR